MRSKLFRVLAILIFQITSQTRASGGGVTRPGSGLLLNLDLILFPGCAKHNYYLVYLLQNYIHLWGGKTMIINKCCHVVITFK